MQLVINSTGEVRCIYGEAIDLAAFGTVTICRASDVEPSPDGWTACLAPVGGPTLGPYPIRSEALAVEQAWLLAHWLAPSP